MCTSLKLAVIAFFFAFFAIGIANSQIASPQCAACRNSCVDRRVACKSYVCRANGGQDSGPQACSGPKNYTAYVQGLKACEDQESVCWDRCSNSTPNCK
jgi:hypothetical protein